MVNMWKMPRIYCKKNIQFKNRFLLPKMVSKRNQNNITITFFASFVSSLYFLAVFYLVCQLFILFSWFLSDLSALYTFHFFFIWFVSHLYVLAVLIWFVSSYKPISYFYFVSIVVSCLYFLADLSAV